MAAVLALVAAILGLLNMQSKFDALAESRRAGPLWIATQLQTEFLRFEVALSQFVAGNENVDADDIRFRFDILWSRVAVALKGQEGRPAARTSQSFIELEELMQLLRSVDATIQELEHDNRLAVIPLIKEFSVFASVLQEYIFAAKDEQAQQDTAARASFQELSRRSLFLGLVVGLASLVNAALFYFDSAHHQRLARHNRELAKEAQAGIVAKSEFISTVSHELRTPLTSIKGALAILDAGHAGVVSEKTKNLVSIALRNSNRLGMLIDDILDFERIEMGKMSYRFDVVVLNEAVRNAVTDNESFMQEYGVKIVTKLPDENIVINGDQMRVEQVLTNLISNAIKFSDKHGEVIVELEAGAKAVVSVRDSGIGIAEEFRDRLFERFSQGDSSSTRRIGGSGLGLSISRSIAEAHNGSIRFDSELGSGTTFYFELPLSVENVAQNAVA